MTFEEVAVEEAVGALAAHSVKAGDVVLKKGQPVTAEAAGKLRAAGIERIVAARLGENDFPEDDAADQLASRIAGFGLRIDPPFTGRANLFADRNGVLMISSAEIDRINAVDESITVATLPAFKPVVEGEMVATVKIIPYAVEGSVFGMALEAIGAGAQVEVAPYRLRRIGVISTLTPGFKPSIVRKTARVFEQRLDPMGAAIVAEAECAHETSALTDAILAQIDGVDLLVVFGASAIADRRDVIPAAIEAAGGRIEHFGMPVDPGNLLLVGELRGKPVLGAPGCARSPKENGFDWVLVRLVAGLPVTRRDITAMGVGGLLMEIVSRGQPRSGGDPQEDEA
jgi:molybdenum cofactor cytidylyltransferase